MPEISKITLPSGNTYDIKDANARAAIAALEGGSYFLGVTTTPLTDGSTVNPIKVDSFPVTATNGNMVIYGQAEFVWGTSSQKTPNKIWFEEDVEGSGHWYGHCETAAEHEMTIYFDPQEGPVGGWGLVIEMGATASDDYFNCTPAGGAGAPVEPTGAWEPQYLWIDEAGSPNSQRYETTTKLNYIYCAPPGKWIEFGDTSTLGELAGYDNITVASSLVSSGSGQSATVVKNGDVTTQALSNNLVTKTTGSTSVVTGVSASKKKLTTTSITPTNGTETVSKVTKTTSHLATKSINSTTPTNATIPNVTSVGSASTFSFTIGSNETLVISGANSVAPTLGAAITAESLMTVNPQPVASGELSATGAGDEIVVSVTISDKTVAKAGSAVTVATGGLSDTSATTNVGETVAIDASSSGSATVATTDGTEINVLKVANDANAPTVVTGVGNGVSVPTTTATISNTVTRVNNP